MRSADLQLYDSELQTEGALTLKAFGRQYFNSIVGTTTNSASDDGGVSGWWGAPWDSTTQIDVCDY